VITVLDYAVQAITTRLANEAVLGGLVLIGALHHSVATVVEACLALASGGAIHRLLICARAATARATDANFTSRAGRT
jgi:hypothetical protein